MSFTSTGIFTASRTQRTMRAAIAGSWPMAAPTAWGGIPPCGQEKLSSTATAPAFSDRCASSTQSPWALPSAMIDAITNRSGQSLRSCAMPAIQ